MYKYLQKGYEMWPDITYRLKMGEVSNLVAHDAPERERHWMIMKAREIKVYQIDTFASLESARTSIDHSVSTRNDPPGAQRPNYFKRSAEGRSEQAPNSQRRQLGLWLSKDKVENFNRGDAEDLLILRALVYELTDAKVEAAEVVDWRQLRAIGGKALDRY